MTTASRTSLPPGLRDAPLTPQHGTWHWFAHRAFLTPDRVALVDGERRWTYRQLADRSSAAAATLQSRLGIGQHDRVATLTVNRAEWVELFLATARLGAILVPLNWRLAVPELEFQLQDSGARAIVADDTHADVAESLAASLGLQKTVVLGPAYEALLARADPAVLSGEDHAHFGDPHVILYTSGTTGRPKGAVLTHANTLWNAVNCSTVFGLSERDVTVTALPMFHSGGVGLFTLPSLHAGGRVVVLRSFDADALLRIFRDEQVTVFFGVPAMWLELLKRPQFTAASFPELRTLGSGGAPCPTAVIDQLAERGFVLLQGYGLTETAPGGTLVAAEDWRRKTGSVGKAMTHVELRVVDDAGRNLPPGEVGEVWFRGPNLFAGYWGRPEATDEAFSSDGWFKSGDLGVLDEEGFLTLVDRKKDMIISGGENVYSAEVEDALYTHPAVAEAAVIGVPDEKWGEVVRAIVALKPGMSVTAEDLVAHCRARLARYKAPRSVVFVDALPRNASGKVLKPELRAQLGTRERTGEPV